MDKFYTIEEISKLYRVSMYTVREWCKAGKVKCIKAGRRWLFKDKDIFFDDYTEEKIVRSENSGETIPNS